MSLLPPLRHRLPGLFSNRIVNDLLMDGPWPGDAGLATIPDANIKETPEAFLLDLAAPGMAKDDFSIRVENNNLCIEASKEDSNERKRENFTRKEYNYSHFRRSFALPESVKTEDINAEYHDDILQLTLPKREDAMRKPVKQIGIT